MWVIFAFGSAVFAGLTAILAKIGIKNTDSNLATAIRTVIILLFSWLMVFIAGSQNMLGNVSSKTYLFLILSGFATGASWLFYFKALQLGDVNKVTPIDKSSTVLTMILAIIFLGESLTVYKLSAMVFITAGTYMMISKKQENNKAITGAVIAGADDAGKAVGGYAISDDRVADCIIHDAGKKIAGSKWLIYAILSTVFASLTSILGKIGISDIESNLGTAVRTIVVFIMAWIIVFMTGKHKEIRKIDRKSLAFICLSGITTGCSWLCYYRALQDGEASIVVPIDKLSILLTIAFSFFFLKEKLTKKAVAGLVLVTAGTLLLLVK